MKSSINPKEKARRKEIFDRIARMEQIDKAAAQRLRVTASLEERAFQQRCATAVRKERRMIELGAYTLEYFPGTGKLVWFSHPDWRKVGESAVTQPKSRAGLLVYGEGGRPHAAPRLCYESVHGEIPEGHVVYCADNDPTNLKATNLRSLRRGEEPTPPQNLDPATREFLRKRNEERMALRTLKDET